MSRKAIPEKEAAWIDAQGRPTPAFLEYVKDLDQRAFREKVSATSPTNGQVLTYNSSTGLWTPNAN